MQTSGGMAVSNNQGAKAEKIAARYLLTMGFTIRHRNWRQSRYEIDIIETKDDVLHFIEVKSLSTDQVIYPEQHVTTKKFQSLKKAASAFLAQQKMHKHVQFDILSIIMNKYAAPEFLLIEDVYL